MSTLRNQENYLKSCSLWCAGFPLLDYLFSVQNMGSEGWNHYHQSFLWSVSHMSSTPCLTCHSFHLIPYRSYLLLESPFHLFVALKLFFFFFSALGEMGKGSRVRWQMGGAQGIKSVKISLNESFSPPNLSMFHSYWGFCSLEISKVYIKRHLLLGGKVTFLDSNLVTNLDSILKSRDITLSTKFHLVKAVVFPVVMYGCKSWTVKKAEHWKIDAFELWCWRRLLWVPWTHQSWVFIGKTDAEAETPIRWPPHSKSWLIGKDPDAGRDWGQEEKGMTEDEMAVWHHWLDAHEFGWTQGVGDGQWGLACCDSWGHKELDTTERLKWTELNWM